MKKYLFAFALLGCVFTFNACDDDDDVKINENELPSTAQAFLTSYFPGESILDTRKDNNEYEVYYANYKVEFDLQGAWKQVDGKRVKGDYKAVPQTFLAQEMPKGILVWVTQNYPNVLIVEAEKEYENGSHTGYDIELSNGIDDLDFDLNGNFITGTIPPGQTVLPENAQTFLNTYFANESIISQKKDDDGEYEVVLASGIELDFDKQGSWNNVDGKFENGQFKALPETFLATELPTNMVSFVSVNYPGKEIIEVDKEFKNNVLVGYEIDLNGGVELDFDTNGNLIGNGGTSTMELPQIAKEFMNIHFSGLTYTTIRDDNEYDVYVDVCKVEFDLQGNWRKVDGEVGFVKTKLPESFLALVPVNKINDYVIANYQGRYIVEIEKDSEKGIVYYDVELDSSTDLVFNAEGGFVSVD